MKALTLLVVAVLVSPALAHVPETDTWAVIVEGDTTARRTTLTFDDATVRGNLYGQDFAGTFVKNKLEFRNGPFLWTGERKGDAISGTLKTDENTYKWTAIRVKKPGSPRSFSFAPKTYSRLYSSALAPALNLLPGDTVVTKTVDASGTDENSKSVTWGGNPLVGPFYVEGAFPGDTLVVKLKSVRTNRGWAFGGRELTDTVLDASYIASRKNERIDNTWLIDTEKKTVRLEKPTENLKDFTVPLAPFLGCVGVAPADGAAMSAKDSGIFGGNMECRFATEGATLYFPVQQLGAYFYLGDGHAAQGDGELAGNALETSLSVTFSVDVIPGKSPGAVRIETDEFLLSLGVAGSLDVAIRQATSDMARWLESDFKLTAAESAVVLGFANIYDIPDMVPPYFGVTSRIPKKALARKP
jgi:amidase